MKKNMAKLWFKALHNDKIPSNEENLIDAILGETYEYEKMYKDFGDIACHEGFTELCSLFHEIAEIEHHHATIFKDIQNELKGELFKEDTVVNWKCLNCGYIHTDKKAPFECPVCKHPQKYFKRI